MTYQLGLRTLVLLAIVAACTAVLVAPELLQEAPHTDARLLLATVALGHG